MIRRTIAVTTKSTDPYRNLAVEEWLTFHTAEDEIILYLWQNDRTVVVGKNQNAWEECDLPALRADGGHPARRLSGGGAVYHDLGNLNFTFSAREGSYDAARQTRVLAAALSSLGIEAAVSGRNDLTANGAKCSGNAFFRSGTFRFHHGTLLVDTNLADMSRYLTPDRKKLSSRGISSVKSRVVNLAGLSPAVTCESLGRALIASFGREYGIAPEVMSADEPGGPIDLPEEEILSLREKYASPDWILSPPRSFRWLSEIRRLPFGLARLGLAVEKPEDGRSVSRISEAVLYTDALDTEISDRTADVLKGLPFREQAVRDALIRANLGEVCALLETFPENDTE